LVNGEVVLRPGKVDGLYEPPEVITFLFEGNLTGRGLFAINVGQTATPLISLLD
jgi:hypothetical protein